MEVTFMLKNILSYVLILFLILFLSPISGAEYSNVQNTSVSGTFELKHQVSRDSFFKTMVQSASVESAGTTTLGRFFVRNNTRDGYSLTISSEQKGVMAPSGDSSATGDGDVGPDGEVAIPYNIKITKDGDVGEGIDSDLEHNSNDLAEDVSVLETVGDSVSSGTNAEFTLDIEIVDDSNVMEMAGEFSDTLTLTYTDL